MSHATTVLGVSIDGFAVEGGYDVEEGPATTFGVAQALGKIPASVRSTGTWDHLDELVGYAADLGFKELRLTVEWARLERRPDQRDDEALERYLRALRAAADRGLTSVVVLCDAALPSWTGAEPWLSAWAPGRFAAHAGWVAQHVEGLARAIVTFRSPNATAREGWRTGTRPPFRRDAGADAVSALDGMLVAHQLALHEIALAAPTVERALLMEAGREYDDESLWRDLASGVADPVLLAARADRFGAVARGAVAMRAFARPGAASLRRTVTGLRSTTRWGDIPPFSWWLASDDPDVLASSLEFAAGAVDTVELGAGRFGWDAQLAAGLPAVTAGPHGATTVHLTGLVGSTGPLAAPAGLLDVDQHDGTWAVADGHGGVARRLAAFHAG